MLAEKGTYSVGRVQADISLAEDNSISRTHAIIHVSADAVKIEDPGSKYGVFLNANDIKLNKPLNKNEPTAIRPGDIVRFGRMNSIWRLEEIVINCCTSTVDANQLPALIDLLRTVNGKFQPTWNEFCTHLVMPNVTVTIKGKPLPTSEAPARNEQSADFYSVCKVLQSLVHGVPIVTPAFWTAYVECVRENRQQLPDVKSFVPEINEQFIRRNPSLLHVDLRRQRLFQGKTFLFMTQANMASFESIIKLAQGDCDFLGNKHNHLIEKKKDLLKAEIIPVQSKVRGQSQTSQSVHNVIDYIEKNGRRAINDSEISLAILHCSIERYCNPDFKMQRCFEVHTIDLTEMDGRVCAEETPETRAPESNRAPAVEIVLPESINLTDDALPKSTIDSSVAYSECADVGDCEMAESMDQLGQPSTSGMNLGKRRRRLSSDDAPVIEQSVEKKSKSNDAVPEDIERTSISESSQSSNLSGFLTTQNRFKKPDATPAPPTTEQPSQQIQIATAERRKRALAALKSLSDDEDNNNDENPFTFARKKPAKRPKLNRMESAAAASNGDDDDVGFNFTAPLSQRKRSSQQKRSTNETNNNNNSSASDESPLMPFNRSATENGIRMAYVQPIEASTDGWLSRVFKKDVSIADAAVNEPALPGGIRIKEEKLEEWEMTEEEKKLKWLKSLANAIEVKTFNVTITRRPNCSAGDETDGNVSALNGTIRNFKTFVKVRFVERDIHSKDHSFILFILALYRNGITLHRRLSFERIP